MNWYKQDSIWAQADACARGGTTRAVVDAAGTVLQATDYYPFGLIMDGRSYLSGSSAKEKFTGQERDDETGFDYFGARFYRADAPGFLQVDPLAQEFPNISPYAYGNNNPLRFTDPTGMAPYDWIRNNETGEYTWDWNVTSEEDTPEGYEYVGKGKADIDAHYKENTSLLARMFGSGPDVDWGSIGPVIKEYNAADYVTSLSIEDNPMSWIVGGTGAVKGASWISKFFSRSKAINQTSQAVLKSGYYEVNGFKFSKYYYNKLWDTGRGAPSLVAKEVLQGAKNFVPDAVKKGFNRYEYGGWEMIYNPKTKEVWHLQPFK